MNATPRSMIAPQAIDPKTMPAIRPLLIPDDPKGLRTTVTRGNHVKLSPYLSENVH